MNDRRRKGRSDWRNGRSRCCLGAESWEHREGPWGGEVDEGKKDGRVESSPKMAVLSAPVSGKEAVSSSEASSAAGQNLNPAYGAAERWSSEALRRS